MGRGGYDTGGWKWGGGYKGESYSGYQASWGGKASSWYGSSRPSGAAGAGSVGKGVASSSSVVQDKSRPSQTLALKELETATAPTDWVFNCLAAILENASSDQRQVERALNLVVTWLSPTHPQHKEALGMAIQAAVAYSVMCAARKYAQDAPSVALACNAIARLAGGSSEGASSCLRFSALDGVLQVMDLQEGHGGVLNVAMVALLPLLKDISAARQAVNLGAAQRILSAMECSDGREIQYNGLRVLKVLADSGRAPRMGFQEASLHAKVVHQNDPKVTTAADDLLTIVTPRFKEVLCWHWQSGWCKLGPRCTYAHGAGDLRGQGIVTGGVPPSGGANA
eukprot:TRINITY_DN11477_c0_g1_i1.p1 TRINITY_DN11477_c0_g1~~TRINITY_DN11477_c0_g1_i1.p1  ORF type:complete len:339 (-),score=74.73 TRINITY_DN11477_c0_g1_i1:156-1172(-)